MIIEASLRDMKRLNNRKKKGKDGRDESSPKAKKTASNE
jgi:hypothetical protein